MPFYKQLQAPCTSTVLILLVPIAFLTVTFFVVHPSDFRLQSFFSSCGATTPSASTPLESSIHVAAPKPDFRLLIGIQTLPSKYERRHLLRTLYALQQPGLTAEIDVRFVFCKLNSSEDAVFVALEIMRYDDIIILDCTENMNNGKTFTFFSTVARVFNKTEQHYDYVMKSDDDTYFRLPALAESLKDKPKEDMYYGLEMPCDTENFFPFPPFMSGMGYALSWDLIQWIATSDASQNDQNGPEDMWTARWFNMAGRATKRFDMAPRMYDYKGPFPANCFRHEFVQDTIAVHMLKDRARWAETLRYFDVTADLKSSELYHIP